MEVLVVIAVLETIALAVMIAALIWLWRLK